MLAHDQAGDGAPVLLLDIAQAALVGNSFGAAVAQRERPAAMQRGGIRAAAGEHDMPDFKLGAEELANGLPRGSFTIIEGAGHLAPLRG